MMGEGPGSPGANKQNANSITLRFGIEPVHVAQAMRGDEIADDVKELLKQIELFARP
jgi:hypothetical protein